MPSAISQVGRTEFWLIEWAKWIRAFHHDLGYPHRAIGLVGGGESRRGEDACDDFADEIWRVNCKAMDALIEGLPPSQCCAVRHAYLGEPWKFPRHNMEKLLEMAEVALLVGMESRGVCI
jgi:hypothetical protein